MYVSYNRDPEICPLCQGVHYRGVSVSLYSVSHNLLTETNKK